MRASAPKVLVLGSGLSAREWTHHDLDEHVVVCINHAWRLLPERYDVWVRPGDFPPAKAPAVRLSHQTWVGHDDYVASMRRFQREIPGVAIGDVTFPRAVCWVLDQLSPRLIGFLGCDHVYNPAAVSRWLAAGQPGPQNRYVGYGDPSVPIEIRREQRRASPLHQGSAVEDLVAWSERFFGDTTPTHFYGHGTPDPMRLGVEALKGNFNSLARIAEALGVELVNYSDEPRSLLPFRHLGEGVRS